MSSNRELCDELIARICTIMREIATPLEGKVEADVPDDVIVAIDKLTKYRKTLTMPVCLAYGCLFSSAGIFKTFRLKSLFTSSLLKVLGSNLGRV